MVWNGPGSACARTECGRNRRKKFRLFGCLLAVGLLPPVPARAAEPAAGRPGAPVVIDEPLIAHWTFDEPSGTTCIDSSGNGYHASPENENAPGFVRVRGPVGGAIELAGRHKLRVPGNPAFEEIRRISLSAWVLPRQLGAYREIFRKEDGDHRVLFSFQHDGTILSLGLNVGGYVECDARIDPQLVRDGLWHHCAATFDGRQMRVYVDGRQVGSLDRPGAIAAGGSAPGCIGSSNGRENFCGAMDDLRIYAEAITSDQVAALYRDGVRAAERLAGELGQRVGMLYAKEASFVQTLAAMREKVAHSQRPLDPNLAGMLLARLKSDFPDEYEQFVRFTEIGPLGYLTTPTSDVNVREARRLVELALEYRPLTPCQIARCTPEELRSWDEADGIGRRCEHLAAQGDAARFSPEWIQIMLDAGRRVRFRPSVSEPVAPYVTPHTPPTRDLTAAEAQEMLRRDWLHQADGKPTTERILHEIQWTRQLADRIGRSAAAPPDLSAELAQLDALARQAQLQSASDAELYFAVRRVKRAIAFKNPAVDFDKVLLVDMPLPQGREWRHQTRHRLGYMAVPGGRLLVLRGLGPGGKLTQLMPQPPLHGSFWRPDVSYDAKKVLFCFKPHNEKSFHLYEMDVDGGNPVQLTDGPFDDLDPIYLPDGHILFSTTRGHTYVRCMPPTNAYVLARCDPDGSNIYLVSRNNEPDYLPSVMADGRIVYTRWEYSDKPLWRAQGLWTMNPDGTQVATLWGNQSVWPDLLKDARSIPGSHRVMFTGSAHHDWFAGSVGIIDPDQGFNFPEGLTKVTADLPWPESGDGPVDPVESRRYHASGHYAGYYSPYPLGERDFLVSANRGDKFVLYWMDVDGNRELIYEGAHHILHAIPVRPRERPPVVADRVRWPSRGERSQPAGGIIYSNDVYQGAPEAVRGKARYLRILHIEPKTYTYWYKRPYISTGPVVSIVQSEGVKRILGTVPIESDGSVAFQAPAGKALHFQLLDENYRALQTMRSFTGVMPGERRGCLGCHESHSRTPVATGKAIALAKPPRTIQPPPWGEDTVSYDRYVQPVLDRYCGRCHQGDGEARKTLDLTRRPGFRMFDEPYVTLTGKPTWGAAYHAPSDPPPGWGIAGMLMVEAYGKTDPAAYRTPPPMSALSYRSRLIDLAAGGDHYDVRVDPISLRRLIAWVDAMCPYRGDEEVRAIPDPEFQGVDWLAIRPKIHSAPQIIRPGPVD